MDKQTTNWEDKVRNWREYYEETGLYGATYYPDIDFELLISFISKTISQEREKWLENQTPKIQALIAAAITSGEFQKDYGQLAINTTEKIKNLLQK